MADHVKFSHGIERFPTISQDLDGESEEPPSYTAATQHTQHVQEGPGDLSQYSQPSPKVLRYKLEEPQVPATERKMKKLLDGDKIIKISSRSLGRENIVIAEAERNLFEYFSGNVIDWTNSSLGVCQDSVSVYLVDWMKAGGRMPNKGPSATAYREKDLEWLEQLYTIAGNLWMRKLMKQTAKEIDHFNGDDKRMRCLIAERKKRESIIKEAVKQEARASKEADSQKKWLAKHLTDEQKDLMDLDSLDVNDHGARLLIAETYQREKAEQSLAQQQKEADKQMAKQRRKMERALTEQFRKDKSAALILICKRMVGKMGSFAFKLVECGIVAGAVAAYLTAILVGFLAKLAVALVLFPFSIPALVFCLLRYLGATRAARTAR